MSAHAFLGLMKLPHYFEVSVMQHCRAAKRFGRRALTELFLIYEFTDVMKGIMEALGIMKGILPTPIPKHGSDQH